jgi:hypothetical protein
MTMQHLHSTINTKLRKQITLRGALISLPAALALVGFGSYSSVNFLSSYGWIILTASILLVYLGWRPFQKIKFKESHRDKIILKDDNTTEIYHNNELLIAINNQKITSASFQEFPYLYGVRLTLCKTLLNSINVSDIQKKALKDEGFILEKEFFFLPFFTKESCRILTKHIKKN